MRLGVVFLGLLAACADLETGLEQHEIIGGASTSGYPGVVQTYFSGFLCTATVIAPRVLITAAHCVEHVVGTPQAANGTALFGFDTSMPDKTVGTADVRMHRLYDRDNFTGYDIALIQLEADVTETPIPLNTRDLAEVMDVGDPVHVVGYGVSNPEANPPSGVGIKRTVDIPLIGLAPGHIVHGSTTVNTCQGDSGGPHMFVIDGMERVIAVTSFGAAGCRGTSQHSRVDAYLEDFLYPVMDRWDGPCKLDGMCETAGCRTEDPDCNPCGYNDTCAADCPMPDLDCPLGRSFRQTCAADTECETRLCVDDPGYCSRTCTPGDSGSCDQDMECAVVAGEAGDQPVCRKRAAMPDDDDDDGGCGCRVGGARGAGGGAALFVIAGLVALARRRRAA